MAKLKRGEPVSPARVDSHERLIFTGRGRRVAFLHESRETDVMHFIAPMTVRPPRSEQPVEQRPVRRGRSGRGMPASGAARSGSLARSLAILGAGAYLSARAIDAAVNGLDARGRRVALAGRQLHVLDEGEGRAVLLLHGLLGCGSNFQMGLTSALRASGHRVIVPDRAGYGKSPPGPSGIPDQAAQMLDLMDALGIKSCTVCGHSLGGGAIALRMAVMAPERIGRLSLLAPACFLPASQPFAWMIPALPVLVPTLRTRKRLRCRSHRSEQSCCDPRCSSG